MKRNFFPELKSGDEVVIFAAVKSVEYNDGAPVYTVNINGENNIILGEFDIAPVGEVQETISPEAYFWNRAKNLLDYGIRALSEARSL